MSPDFNWTWNGTEWVPSPAPADQPLGVVWARPYESAGFRATFVTVFLLANAAALFIGIIFDLVDASFGADISALSDEQVVAVGLLGLAFLISYYGSFIPCVVLFCMWVHRVVRNMPALGSADARWSPAGAVGRCFIPILNFIHPLSGTLEAWRASDPTRRWMSVVDRRQVGVPFLIVGWWSSWLVGRILSSVSFQMSRSDDPATQVISAWVDVVGSVVMIAAAVLALLVVREVTARQDDKNALIMTGRLV